MSNSDLTQPVSHAPTISIGFVHVLLELELNAKSAGSNQKDSQILDRHVCNRLRAHGINITDDPTEPSFRDRIFDRIMDTFTPRRNYTARRINAKSKVLGNVRWTKRRKLWKLIEHDLGLKLPNLQMLPWIFWGSIFVTVAVMVALQRLALMAGFPEVFFIFALPALVSSLFIWLPLRVHLPPEIKTFADLADHVAATNCFEANTLTPKDIELILVYGDAQMFAPVLMLEETELDWPAN